MNCYNNNKNMDYGPDAYVLNVTQMAVQNRNFRTAVWTGEHMQMTLMSISPYEEIGWEKHCDTEQFIRIEQGRALLQLGSCKCKIDYERELSVQEAVFVPAGTWHNIKNAGRCPLKISSVYAPPQHPRGTIHHTKKDAERSENDK